MKNLGIKSNSRLRAIRSILHRQPGRGGLAAVGLLCFLGGLGLSSPAAGQASVRVSLGASLGKGVADGYSDVPAVSADGRYVAFISTAGNMTAGSFPGRNAVYVRDRVNSTTTMVSVNSNGTPANADSAEPAISGDGRYVVFSTSADNLGPGATAGAFNVFVHDMVARTTACVSLRPDGSPGDGDSLSPSISQNGRFVAFASSSGNLVAGDSNGQQDIFVRDLTSSTTTLVSVAANGGPSNTYSYGPSISGDGRYVAFIGGDGNLAAGDNNEYDDVFVRDTVAKTTVLVSTNPEGAPGDDGSYLAVISADGRHVAFESSADDLVPGDGNHQPDVFERNLDTNVIVRLSVANSGAEAAEGGSSPSISSDGRYVTFTSTAANLVSGDTNAAPDVFVRDTTANTTERVSLAADGSQGSGSSFSGALSADGHIVAFASNASNIVPADVNGTADVFVRDRTASTTSIASVATQDAVVPANRDSFFPAVSSDGRYVAFISVADNLVPNDTNGAGDVFVRDTWTNTTERVSVASDGTQADGPSFASNGGPAISADGRYVAFVSKADNLVPGDTNNAADVFVRDRVGRTTIRVSVAGDGTQANGDANNTPYSSCGISADGRYVAFVTSASNLVPGDTNNAADVFLRDTVAGTTERINVRTDGSESREGAGGAVPSISADGRYVVFDGASDLFGPDNNIYTNNAVIRDRVAHTTTRQVTTPLDSAAATNGSFGSQISADGKSMVFATVLTPAPANGQWKNAVFLEDLTTGTLTWVSRPPNGDYPDDSSFYPAVSADGQYVVFLSQATNLVPGDTSKHYNIYRWERTSGKITRVTQAPDGSPENLDSSDLAISGDGRYVAFDSLASNLVANDTNNADDVFLRGPYFGQAGAFSIADARTALRIAGGLANVDAASLAGLNVEPTEAGINAIDIQDAIRLVRKAAGLDPNP